MDHSNHSHPSEHPKGKSAHQHHQNMHDHTNVVAHTHDHGHGQGEHDKHAGHSVADFKQRFIISTIASIATLVGLIGTVLGMIKAFSALSAGGAPDAVGLANGISEALINTALGITGSAIAIIMYNFFTSKIDELTYSIDEAGFSIIQTFASQEGNATTTNAPQYAYFFNLQILKHA